MPADLPAAAVASRLSWISKESGRGLSVTPGGWDCAGEGLDQPSSVFVLCPEQETPGSAGTAGTGEPQTVWAGGDRLRVEPITYQPPKQL